MGIAASSGSACASGSVDPSHVLLAIGVPVSHGSRISRISWVVTSNTAEEADRIVEAVAEAVALLREKDEAHGQKRKKAARICADYFRGGFMFSCSWLLSAAERRFRSFGEQFFGNGAGEKRRTGSENRLRDEYDDESAGVRRKCRGGDRGGGRRNRHLDTLLQRGEESSEIYQLNSSGSREVSEETLSVIKRALEIAEATDGAFDPSIAPAADLWGFTDRISGCLHG